jgi:putative ABC transport system ATP-binding protein
VAIVGPSGAGKSTLLRLCAALALPAEGDVLVGGVSTRSLDGKELAHFRREKVGLVFQQFSLLPTLTALENAILPLLPYSGREVLRKRAASLLAEVGLGQRLEHYPDQLSGGEQQRVAIARALIASQPVLLADEPTGSLDAATGRQVMTLLDKLCREHGCTLLVVTHDAAIAGMADRIVEMRDGCLIEGSVMQR